MDATIKYSYFYRRNRTHYVHDGLLPRVNFVADIVRDHCLTTFSSCGREHIMTHYLCGFVYTWHTIDDAYVRQAAYACDELLLDELIRDLLMQQRDGNMSSSVRVNFNGRET